MISMMLIPIMCLSNSSGILFTMNKPSKLLLNKQKKKLGDNINFGMDDQLGVCVRYYIHKLPADRLSLLPLSFVVVENIYML